MEDKKVAILMSTYNGEKYIQEQLESLINQTYKNIDILIRDDGSKDNTKNIIKEYQKKYKNITLIEGKNIGVLNSFFELLKLTEKADYYSYCDQDDVWLENKIELAVKALNEKEKIDIIPILYSSNYDYYDGNMNFKSHTGFLDKTPSFAKSIVECVAPGMTMVINNKLREILINNIPEYCLLHDWWTYQVCTLVGGEVIYDNNITVKYRRHGDNVTTVENGFIKKLVWRIKTFLFSEHWKNLQRQINSLYNLFENKLENDNKKLLKLFTKKITFLTQIRKVFYPIRFKDNLEYEIMIRCMFLIGRI